MMSFFSLVIEWLPQLLKGVLWTLRLMGLSFLVAAVLALPIALARLSSRRYLRVIAQTYVEIIRGMPSLTLLFVIYFGLPSFGLTLHAMDAAVLGLGLNGAAYVSEIYRSGIQAIDSGQREAAQMIGMRSNQILRYVVLPQALRVVLPPMGNFGISLLKDTSVASLISAPELMMQAKDLTSEYYMPLEIYIVVGLMYLMMALPLSYLVRIMESHLSIQALDGRTLDHGKV
ncbi:His/Glu/Gln/Arg/opine family amino acid ABC transporter permease subunit [Bosea sp. BE271]|uniref:amino acid ABC transporter permease n=2 Tax=Boseaceae TaxID=2831100 RepID=UPI0028580394|nr:MULTISPECIES: amino acid ABC transporter permease [Bosea]MDR6827663.1 His/Glu/Gln/Arg/opine family amino acid ABC transporter permease subunit [Bosea robiniae]MDR6894643.1 His/Glu/Gln/Arg/opine family amino acid ABC transporter permease subunit [Bosea sp. BE109]MDR7137769.1 His/Glu/Gln/Arg/opine family amino acid ABC transporter permease subunit [Bosea sp. BE168]MDR7174468.1 His/Glu/Gln/Arg/opine family amino acid ABC transporter permease subunit [Bosea sp. BE271]